MSLLGASRSKMLRITFREDGNAMGIILEGRIVGLWAAELSRVWKERAPHLGSGKLSLDLRNVTYADTYGKQALRDICAFTDIELIANTPWTRNLAGEIVDNTRVRLSRENQPAGNAVAVCIRVNRASLMEPPSADTSRPAA
jgi:hypothetical protein